MRNVMRNTWLAGGLRYVETEATVVRGARRAFKPAYRVTRRLGDLLRSLERLDQDLQGQDLDDAAGLRVLRDAVATSAFATASIEGNPHTLEQVQSLLARGPSPEGVTEPTEKEFHLYARFILDLDSYAFPRTCADVCALHKGLFSGVIPRPGRLKHRPNFIGERASRTVIFVPTLPKRTPLELQALLDWFHAADEHPVVRAAVFFHEFQSIHPFLDGNGRLGRALLSLALWDSGYRGVRFAVVDAAFNNDRASYYDALQETRVQGDDLTVWLDYVVPILEGAFRDALHRFRFAEALPVAWNDRTIRVAEAVARLDKANRRRRFKFADLHALFPHVPPRTLQLDLKRLVDARIVERSGTRKAATYRFAFRPAS